MGVHCTSFSTFVYVWHFSKLKNKRDFKEDVCDSQLPRWPPVILSFWYSCHCVVFFHTESSLVHVTKVEITAVILKSQVTVTSALFSLGSLALKEESYYAVRTLKQSCGEAFMERSQGLLPSVSCKSEPCKQVSVELTSSPSQAFQWLYLHLTFDSNCMEDWHAVIARQAASESLANRNRERQ